MGARARDSERHSRERVRMAGDEGFREIHLSGKHLVALFMGLTLFAAVIFLCGVMVGRGVRNATAANVTPDAAQASTGAGNPAPPAAASEAANTTQSEFAVQVAALGGRAAAEAVVKRLTAKGYAAYLLEP